MRTGAALLVLYAGMTGAAGIALAAAGTHGAELAALATPAHFLIMHAAAALAAVAIALRASRPGLFLTAALLMLAGVTLFSGDVSMRALLQERLFPMAAPVGGTTMIIGWLIAAIGGLTELFAAPRD